MDTTEYEVEHPDDVEEIKAIAEKPVELQGTTMAPISLDQWGMLAPKDHAEEWRVATMALSTGALPKQFKNTAQVMMAFQFLKQHKLPTLVAIRQTTIINDNLSIWGELPLGLVNRSGLMNFFDEYLFDKDYNKICVSNKNLNVEVFGAVCIVKRKDYTVTERFFTIDDAKKANLWTKDIWKLYPKRMLQMRARSIALKDAFADVLSGIAISEYDHDSFGPDEMRQFNLPTKGSIVEEVTRAYGGSSEDQAN